MEKPIFVPRFEKQHLRHDNKLAVPCRFYTQGVCRNGQNCRFSHLPSQEIPKTDNDNNNDKNVGSYTSRPDTRSQLPCQFYSRGLCRKGEACPYAHVGRNVADHENPQKMDEGEKSYDTWARQICGAVARFGDGAKVEKVCLPSDFSAVHLNMLPTGSTLTSISEMLAEMGFTVPLDCIRVTPRGRDTEHSSADIRVEDASFAKSFCDRLNLRRSSGRGGTIINQIKAVPVNASMPQGLNSRLVDCRKVHCSWHKPVQVVWLNFGKQNIAREVSDGFNTGLYKVLGQRVASKGVTGSGGGFRNPLAWTVTLTDVPVRATERDITSAIPVRIRPRHVERRQTEFDDDLADLSLASVVVKSMLEQVGQLEWWEDAVETAGKRVKTKARFRTEEGAREAVTLLNGRPLPFNKNDKLTLQLVYSTKFKVSARVFDVVQPEIELQNQTWRSQHLVFIAYAPNQGYRVLKVEGENSKDVGQAKNALEKILEGEIAMHEDKSLWAPCFGINGDKYHRMKDIEKSLGVVIVRNKRLRRLHLYGPQEKRNRAQMRLVDLAKEDLSAERTIRLDHKQFLWACHGGFKAVSHALGDGIATFDVISEPKLIVITGSDDDFRLATSIIQDGKETEQVISERPTQENDCTICWTEAERPIRTRCKHIYCADCFENLCFSSAAGKKECSIRCEGDSGKCMTVLPLDELQEQLSSKTFEDLLESSFASYVQQRPQDFRYCPTPNCDQIYRVATTTTTRSATAFTCMACLETVCTSCHVSHPRMTCAEYKDHASGGYKAFERAKKELGIKDCPKCTTPIEKTYGCNHMTCGGCGIHICWQCLKTFADSTSCYSHMNQVHGSIMDLVEVNY